MLKTVSFSHLNEGCCYHVRLCVVSLRFKAEAWPSERLTDVSIWCISRQINSECCSLMCFMCCKYAEQKRKQAQMIMAHYSPLSICSLICTCVLVDSWNTTSYGLKEQSKCPKCYVSILKQCSKKWQTLESKIMKSVKGLAVFWQGSKPPIWPSFWQLGPRI